MGKLILLVLVLILGVVSMAIGEVSTRVCLADSNTPFPPTDPNFPHIYPDIMVGMKLTIIVDSNIAEPWSGSLAIEEEYWDYGVLSARDYNESMFDYEGSHFDAAGNEAVVWDWEEPGIDGFDLYTGSTGIETGDWFIIDYNATGIGDCNVGFYDHNVSMYDPIYYLMFSHVRTRDFNNDTKVDFRDYAILASYWQETDCNDPNWCEGTDLDVDGSVDVNDLMLFCKYWLARTDGD
ncbi:MAG: hypothetical protein DRP62_02250 [Planctomycetota bacterium]|nr:MAG: hypothetical protein DRP62_02250 [Planctomycetota bacterium]